jgi:predicted short-subunit dehydrogenase-like oxidoreductase (DUF2520 family)
MTDSAILIIGAGRMGRGLGLALSQQGVEVRLYSRSQGLLLAPLAVAGSGAGALAEAVGGAELILLAVPDDAIAGQAVTLERTGRVVAEHVVLHLSGLLNRSALAVFDRTGAALGSFHPLQTIADPAAAPALLRGAVAGIEGDERALAAGRRLAERLGMRPIELRAAGKASYHAGASMVANYTVTLMGIAQHLAEQAGVPAVEARRMYLPLLEGALENLRSLGPIHGLTGPVRRGDVETLKAHLGALDPAAAELYCRLGLAALELAREAGLRPDLAERVERLLRGWPVESR